MTRWNSYVFQTANSYIILELIHFHDRLNLLLSSILALVAYFIVAITYNKIHHPYLIDNHILERLWIFTPSLILIKIAIPSLAILYLIDDLVDSSLSLKVNAHQWFWRYEYTDFWSLSEGFQIDFDTYIIPSSELEDSIFRLLDVDNRTIVPFNVHTRILVTSADVLHAWTVPSLGVKVDAVPGRLNQLKFISQRPGLFFGQCSEICGANHRFIPITLESVKPDLFLNWVLLSQD